MTKWNLVLATRTAPELCHAIPEIRHCEELSDEAIQRGTTHQLRCPTKPRYRTGLLRCARNDEGRKKQKKEAERRQTRDPTVRILRCGARPLVLLLPKRAGGWERGALACRRSTTALAAATERYSSAPDTRFLGLGRGARSQMFEQPGSKDRALLSGRYPLLPVPVQRASRGPVIVPAGRISPEPPGSGGDEPPPAGTALAPPAGVTGRRPLRERDSLSLVAEIETGVKRGILYLTDPTDCDTIDP